MAASIGGFAWSHQYAPSGDVPHAVSFRWHGRRNCRQFCCILLHHGSRIKLITRLFYCFILNPVNTPLPDPFGRGYPRPIGCIHRYHAVGGANGTTMVVMFVGLLCWDLRYFPYYSYCRNPTVRKFFVPAGTQPFTLWQKTHLPWGAAKMSGILVWQGGARIIGLCQLQVTKTNT